MADPLVVMAAVGAGVAIAQPWLIAFWRRYIRKGTVTPYVTGFLELGFGEYGPTLAIDGTLRALHKDVFVKSIDVLLTKNRDRAQHVFDWLVFRSHRIGMAGQSGAAYVEAASGFMVSPDTPKRTCIVFSDSETRERIQTQILAASNRYWSIRRNEHFAPLDQRLLLDENEQLRLIRALDEAYHQDPVEVGAYSEIERICYWEEGTYDIEMRVHAARPDRTFREFWTIYISEEQARQLRLNTVKMLNAPMYADLGWDQPPHFFVYVPYKDKQ